MNYPKLCTATLIILLVAGCSQIIGVSSDRPSTQESFYGTFLFVDKCKAISQPEIVSANEFGEEIALSLATGVIKTGIDWIGAALQKAAQDDIAKTTVFSNMTAISKISNPNELNCLQVVRGRFSYAEASGPNTYSNRFSVEDGENTVAPLEMVEGSEELFIELLPIIVGGYVAFVPLEVRYNGYTPVDRKSRKPRDLAIFVGYSLPDKDVSTGNFSGRLINFGTLIPDGTNPAKVKYVNSSEKLSLANMTQWLSLPESSSDKPMTFSVSVIETREASQFTKFLAAAFESRKEDIKTQSTAALAELDIFKSSRELDKAKIELAQERIKSEETYLDAIADVMAKNDVLMALCDAQPTPAEIQIYKAQKDIYFAQKKANVAADIAVVPRPYKDNEIKLPDGVCEE